MDGQNVFLVCIITFFVLIFITLGTGLFALVRQKKDEKQDLRLIKSLTWRIGLSLFLFCLLLLAFAQGWIHPHALGG